MSVSGTVSIIIPAYNAAAYLAEAIEAALVQTLAPHEIIVVDDGSRDGTPDVCARYAGRITTIRQDNKGEAGARNTALAAATGEFISLLDADDTCAPDRLEKQVGALREHPDAVGCFTGHWVFNEHGVTGRFPAPNRGASATAEEWAAELFVHPITMMFRRVPAMGVQFPVGVYTGGDMLFTGLLRRRGPLMILPDVLYGYRRHDAQITASGHDLDTLRYRLAWLQENAATVWPDLDVRRWEVLVWHAMAGWLQGHYWARRKAEFDRLGKVLNDNWPAYVPRAAALDLKWHPDWLWRLKGAGDAIRARFR